MFTDQVHVECRSCPVRGAHCDDCMVTALWSLPVPQRLDPDERYAVDLLVAAGLVSPAGAAAAQVSHERQERRVV